MGVVNVTLMLLVGLIGLVAASTQQAKGDDDGTAYVVPIPPPEDASRTDNGQQKSDTYSHTLVNIPIKPAPVPLDPVRHRKLLEAIYFRQDNVSYSAQEVHYLGPFGTIEWHQDQEPQARRQRAINALTAPANELGWIVSVEAHFPGSSSLEFCTGSLISNQVVITAAHCVFRNGVLASWLQVTYGGNAQTGPSVTTNAYIVDLRYLSNTEFACGDIALVFLSQPIPLCGADGVRAIRMPWELGSAASVRQQTDGVSHRFKCYSLGFGITETGRLSPIARHVPVGNMAYAMEIGGECITANYTTNAKLCSGDSGGPLVCEIGGRPLLVGVQVNIVAESIVQGDLAFCFSTYAVSAVSSDSLQNFVQATLQARNLLAGFNDPGKTCGSR